MKRELAIAGFLLSLFAPAVYLATQDWAWGRETSALPIAYAVCGILGGLIGFGARGIFPKVLGVASLLLSGWFLWIILMVSTLPTSAHAPVVGQAAPSFTLPDQNGQPVALADRLSKGPVLLVFFRGHW